MKAKKKKSKTRKATFTDWVQKEFKLTFDVKPENAFALFTAGVAAGYVAAKRGL